MKPKFTVGMLGGACKQGALEAARLFKRNKQYTPADIIEAGASPANIVWLLLRRSQEDQDALDLMKAWARQACTSAGIKPRKLKTGDDCFAAVKDAMRARNRANGGSRGGKQWAFDQLRSLAESLKGNDHGTG